MRTTDRRGKQAQTYYKILPVRIEKVVKLTILPTGWEKPGKKGVETIKKGTSRRYLANKFKGNKWGGKKDKITGGVVSRNRKKHLVRR